MSNLNHWKTQFPAFEKYPDVVFLDNAGSTLKPQCVLNKMTDIYAYAGVRYFHNYDKVSTRLKQDVKGALKNIAAFIGAKDINSIICIPGTTYGLNQIAFGLEHLIKPQHNIVISHFEHSSNMGPWIRVSHNTKAPIRFLSTDKQGAIILSKIPEIVDSNTRVMSLAMVNNSTGCVQNIKSIVQHVRQINPNVIIVIDAAQTIAHDAINVQDLDIDFLVFGAHKIYGPLGVGIMWGRSEWLQQLKPLTVGGGALHSISNPKDGDYPNFKLENTLARLQAGTSNFAGLIIMNEAIRFVQSIGFDAIHNHSVAMKKYFINSVETRGLGSKIQIHNPSLNSPTTILFNIKGFHPHDVAAFLSSKNIICRAGDFCAKEVPRMFSVPSLLRISFAIYNSFADIDILLDTIQSTDTFIGF